MTTKAKQVLTVEYDPVLDVYYIPSRSRGDKIEKWPVWESKNKFNKKGELKWFCDCEDWTMNLDNGELGDCRHIQLAKFYRNNGWTQKHMVIRKT